MNNHQPSLKPLITSITVMLLSFLWFVSAPAYAVPAADYFGRTTRTNIAPAAQIAPNNVASAASWFESFDKLVTTYSPTDVDRVILSRPFDQEVERVQQWTQTATRVAKNYRQLAKSIKALPTPPNFKELKEFKNLVADWYDDSALVFEDLIRPRTAAHTIEELQAQLNEIKERSDSLAQTSTNLKSMEMSLRQNNNTHLPVPGGSMQQFTPQPATTFLPHKG